LIAQLDLSARFKSNPIALSEAILLNPSSDLSHPGLAPLMQALMTEGAPNALATLQTKPADPLSPSASISAMSDPMRVVNAPTGMRLFPKVMEWMPRSSEVAEVKFDMVVRIFKGHVLGIHIRTVSAVRGTPLCTVHVHLVSVQERISDVNMIHVPVSFRNALR
jgi:hypothetical protein